MLLRIIPHEWSSFPFFVKVCFIISLLALLGILLTVLDIYVWRTYRKRREEKRASVAKQVQKLLLTAVIPPPGETGSNGIRVDITPFNALDMKDRYVRRILVEEMISYRNYFSGLIAARVASLYIALELDQFAKKQIGHRRWDTRVYALMELFRMDVPSDQDELYKLIHDKNRYVRDYARLSLIKFTKQDPLELLREIYEPISQWEAFEIFLLFQQYKQYKPGSMKGLLDVQTEPSMLSLCLQLVAYFNDASSARLVVDLLATPDLRIRVKAVETLGKLGLKTTGDYLVQIYPAQPYEIRIAILKALGMMRHDLHLDFLENEFVHSEDFEIKKYASDAIIQLYPLSQATIEKLSHSAGAMDQRILNHSLNPLTKAV